MVRSINEDICGKLDISKIKPYGDHILLEVLERNRSAAGLIIPNKEKSECLFGRVLATGPGEMSPRTGEVFPMDIQVGDILMSVQYMGEKINSLGKKYRLLREHGVWAKLKVDFKSEYDFEITELMPYRDHLVVTMDKEEKSLKGHVYLPANPQAMFRLATMVSAGPGPRDKNTGVVSDMGLSKGDRLIILRYAGCIVRIGGVEHRVASWDDIEGIMDPATVVDVIADANRHPKPVDDYSVMSDAEICELNTKTLRDSK